MMRKYFFATINLSLSLLSLLLNIVIKPASEYRKQPDLTALLTRVTLVKDQIKELNIIFSEQTTLKRECFASSYGMIPEQGRIP